MNTVIEPRCVNVVSSAFGMVTDNPTRDTQSLHGDTGGTATPEPRC